MAYDLASGEASLFAAPAAVEDGLGFVSMLACTVYCGFPEDECRLVTSDFAGGLRVFSLDGTEVYAVGTTYTPGASTGSVAIDDATNLVYVTGFLNETTPGVVMRFDLLTGESLPADGQEGAIYFEDASLVRPIGIMVLKPTDLAGEMEIGDGEDMEETEEVGADADVDAEDTGDNEAESPASASSDGSEAAESAGGEPESSSLSFFYGFVPAMVSLLFTTVLIR